MVKRIDTHSHPLKAHRSCDYTITALIYGYELKLYRHDRIWYEKSGSCPDYSKHGSKEIIATELHVMKTRINFEKSKV